ncbi:hypothetical protein C8N47_11066 [Mangrovibacterium marinum]|uniref:Uncharacterized protein n=1 Tax=Mangrovibacterium marinum TaxID=1639118 RepID=A0A2T5C0N5_9BACT|nr:hypothetical protein C8N47_11066 [Mangrovibacterium marinum]
MSNKRKSILNRLKDISRNLYLISSMLKSESNKLKDVLSWFEFVSSKVESVSNTLEVFRKRIFFFILAVGSATVGETTEPGETPKVQQH